MTGRWKHRPPGSNWGEFGPDDQCGRLNLLTSDRVRQGLAEAREGIAFNLSLPLDYPGGNRLQPRRHPPRLQAASRDGADYYVRPAQLDHAGCSDVICDDAVLLDPLTKAAFCADKRSGVPITEATRVALVSAK